MIVVVLGMHKSGTTLVSRLLHRSGIEMLDADDDRSYDQGNQYERECTLRINDRLLGSAGVESISIRARVVKHGLDEIESDMQRVVDELQRSRSTWGFKDPRTCLTYPYWERVLPPHVIVAVMRSPQEVWLRYRRTHRNPLRRVARAWRVANAWTRHNEGIAGVLERTTQPAILLDYRALVTTDHEFRRLEEFLGRELVDERRRDLYRNRADDAPLFDMVSAVYRGLHRVGPHDVQQRLAAMRTASLERTATS